MPCSLTSVCYQTTLDHLQFQEYAGCVLSFMLFLLTCSSLYQNALPLLHLANSFKTQFQCPQFQKPFSESSCLSLASRARISKFGWPLKLTSFPFVAWQVAGSASLRNSPKEQAYLVTDLCRLLLNSKAISL